MNDNILEEVVDELMQLGEQKFFNTIMLLKLVSARANEMNKEIVDLRQQLSSAQFISAAMSATKESLNRSIVDGRTWKNRYMSLADKFDARSQTLEILKRKNAELEQSIESEREIRYTYQENSGKLFEKNQELEATIAAMRSALEEARSCIYDNAPTGTVTNQFVHRLAKTIQTIDKALSPRP
ncbi:hypothetical protein [Anaerospora hongkongensis]|uniref:hypothetical protein n=1 Tax=Anaerospora hongkongensis TaxID=244830 RepID=UPI002FDAA4B8